MRLETGGLIACDRAIEAGRPFDGTGPATGTTTRPMGPVAICGHRHAVGRAAEEGGVARGAHGAGGAHVAASHPRRADARRPLDPRALVLPRAPFARRSGACVTSPPAARCRTAAGNP